MFSSGGTLACEQFVDGDVVEFPGVDGIGTAKALDRNTSPVVYLTTRAGGVSGHGHASRGLASLFGLDARAAVLVILVDLMVFGADVLSVGALLPVAMFASAVLGFIVYRIQTHWYGDDRNSAVIKALIVALLTAIPAPLSPLVALPGGLLGLARTLRRK